MGSCLALLARPCQPHSKAPLSHLWQTCKLGPRVPTAISSSMAEHCSKHHGVTGSAQELGRAVWGRTYQ